MLLFRSQIQNDAPGLTSTVEIFLATKFANYLKPDGSREVRNEPEYVKEACAKSLKRLGIPTIDLYYCHRLSGKVPVEDMVKAMAELVQ